MVYLYTSWEKNSGRYANHGYGHAWFALAPPKRKMKIRYRKSRWGWRQSGRHLASPQLASGYAIHAQQSTHKVPKSASQAVLSRMQLTFHATRRTPPNTSRRFVLGASNVCLVGENPTCSVPASLGCEGLWSYDYGHA